MKVHIANKVLSGLAAILSLIVLSTCIWILTSLLLQKFEKECEGGTEESWKYEDSRPSLCHNSTQPPDFEEEPSHGHHGHDTVVIESRTKSESLTKFYPMETQFYLVILICLSIAIAASLTQFVCSLVIIFCPPYKIASRSRQILVVLFITFCAFLACLVWPITYKRDETLESDDKTHSMSTLNSALSDFLMNFQITDLVKDLTLYYIELFTNILFLFLYMVITCCLLRCNESHQYDV